MNEDFVEVDVGGYEGKVGCPNCGFPVDIKEFNNSEVVECPEYKHTEKSGCGATFKVYARVVDDE